MHPDHQGAPQDTSSDAASLEVELLALCFGDGAAGLLDDPGLDDLSVAVATVRTSVGRDLGLVLPRVHGTHDHAVPPGHYRVVVDGWTAAEAPCPDGNELVIPDPGTAGPEGGRAERRGWPVTEPVFGLPAYWTRAPAHCGSDDVIMGPVAVVAGHLNKIVRENASDLLCRQQVRDRVDALRSEQPALVEDVDHGVLPLATLHAVLQVLLAEGRSIRNLRRILESLTAAHVEMATFDQLVSTARMAVAPQR